MKGTTTLVLEILSFWHAGTGRGDGPAADAVVARDRDGLPYLPGRTVKGLLRDCLRQAAQAGMVSAAQVDQWFGTDLPRGVPDNRERRLEEARFSTKAGSLHVGSATLGSAWAAWARTHPVERDRLVSTYASTSVGSDGTAKDDTLRVIEIAVPMTLRAPIEGLDDDAAKALRAALPLFLRALGSQRRRGLGRVVARLEEGNA